MFCWLGQYIFQYADWEQNPFLRSLEGMTGPSQALETLGVSRLLIWVPVAWPTAGMSSAVRGEWGLALLFLALSIAGVALLLRLHAGITRRLMQGAALSIGAERVRSRRWRVRLPGPPALWAVFRKDWLYLWRSPMPRRLIFSSVIMTAATALSMLRGFGENDVSLAVQRVIPILIGAFVLVMTGMAINMGLTANYFGAIDREGFATLALSATNRRYMLLSANLAALLYAGLQFTVISLVIAILTGLWAMLPLGVCLGLCLQIGSTPAYNLAAIIGPYRTQLKFSRGTRQRGNAWGMLAWIVSAPPVLALIVLPYILWKPALVITIPLAITYSVGLYALTLKPLAKLLQRREHAILEAVTAQE
jgi:ABC-2 type transport system permease protein